MSGAARAHHCFQGPRAHRARRFIRGLPPRPKALQVMSNPVIFGEHEPNTIAQLKDVASRAERAALMADGHLGYVMPIGGVAAYRDQVSVVGVGFDIACGNAAIRTDLSLHGTPGLVDALPELADEIQRSVSFGVGRKNRSDDAPIDHPLFGSASWDALPPQSRATSATRRARSWARSAAATTTSTCSSTSPTPSGSASTSAAVDSVTRSRQASWRCRRTRNGERGFPSAKRSCPSISRWARTTGP